MERKTALITGASRGIGKAIAEKFASEGYDLFLTCIHQEHLLLELKKQLESRFGISCCCFCTDMGNPADVELLFNKISAVSPCLDVLVNNAGISYVGLLTDMSYEQWNRLIQTNLSSAFYTSRLAIPMMLKRHRGKIINISSVWGCVGASCEAAYSAAKGGINAFTSALAKELAPSNIQVNAIACGAIDTDMNHFLTAEEKEMLIEEIPAGRMGLPQEVANLAFSLCEAPVYLTGQIIKLDGGWI